MKHTWFIFLIILLMLCRYQVPMPPTVPTTVPTATVPTSTPPNIPATLPPSPTLTATTPPTATPLPTFTATTLPTLPTTTPLPPTTSISFCKHPAVLQLIESFKTALIHSDGEALSKLVSPTHGMDVRIFRNGNVINYDQEHAKFVFVSTFQANWGNAPGSGEPVQGSFSNVVLPKLLLVFTQPYNLQCNQLQHGGATYTPSWPYPGTDFYSAYYAGTSANGYLDWYTWAIGIEFVGDTPYLFALVPFFWEP